MVRSHARVTAGPVRVGNRRCGGRQHGKTSWNTVGAIVGGYSRSSAPEEHQGRVELDQPPPGALVVGLHPIQHAGGGGAEGLVAGAYGTCHGTGNFFSRSRSSAPKKKGVEPSRSGNPDQGALKNSPADAPFGARHKWAASSVQEAEAQVGRIPGSSNLTHARRSDCIYVRLLAGVMLSPFSVSSGTLIEQISAEPEGGAHWLV